MALAAEMVPEEARPQVAVAAGLDATTFGTDAAAISEAIAAVDSTEGVLVLMDLGSALMSAEMALEFVDPDVADRVRLSGAPLVEGLVAALVTASTGASLADVAREAAGALEAKNEHLGDHAVTAPSVSLGDQGGLADESFQTSFRHAISNPHGLHARPAAALVSGLRGLAATVRLRNATTGAGPADARSLGKVAGLGLRLGHVLEASVSGPEAAQALDRLTALAAANFGEDVSLAASGEVTAPTLRGTGRQIVVGPARVVGADVGIESYEAGDAITEAHRLDRAVSAVVEHLEGLAAGDHGDIFGAQLALLADPELREGMDADVSSGMPATAAVMGRVTALAAEFDALDDPYLRDRAEDVRSLRRLLLLSLTGQPLSAGAEDQPHVLVVAELDAATAARLDNSTLAVITTQGGATGHGVIVASSRGIPVVTGRADLTSCVDGTVLAVDAADRRVWVSPHGVELDAIEALKQARAEEARSAEASARDEARTRCGVRILVEANLASLSDATVGKAAGADGSGLVRTELLFGHCSTAPSASEQAAAFIEIGRALGGVITIRTWDPGGDKPLPFLTQSRETNPMLGERGIRAMRTHEALFRDQLRAVALASREIPCRVMIPMVTEPSEVRWARDLLTEILGDLIDGDTVADSEPTPTTLDFGMMVEVPAAAVRAADFVDLVDFVSIGTNDLTQYTTAADRGNGTVSHLAKADSAAVLDLIAQVGRAFAGKPVAVCGDLASDPDLTARLISLGVTELSVRPPLIGLVKQAVRRC